jgi:hypothetical protein
MMYSPAGLPKTLSCLLAIAIAVQPAFSVPCLCSVPAAGAAKPAAGHRCCCTGGPVCHCGQAGGMSCCQHKSPAGKAPSTACTCNANSPAPQFPPAQKSGPADDLAPAPLPVSAVVIELPQEVWEGDCPSAFASASERCIALGKLRF